MSRGSLLRLSIAVFFIVAALGPVTILMQSEIKLMLWSTIAIQTFACGGLGATAVLVGRSRRWALPFVILFWAGVMFMNSGGLSLIFTDQGTFRAELSGPSGARPQLQRPTDKPLTIQADELSAIYSQRGILGILALVFVGFGSALLMRVVRKEVNQRARLETEMAIAKEIQESLLPPQIYTTSWCKSAGRTLPAAEVGGDYFDVVELADGRLALCIADVTGHGVGAGILSSMTKSAFLTELRHDPSPVALLRNLNETLIRVSSGKMFVTFAYALIDWPRRTARVATAGHPPVLHRSGPIVTPLRTPSLALGMRADASFHEIQRTIDAGDSIVLFTDGLTETRNAREEQFELERLAGIVAGSAGDPQNVSENIFRALEQFRGRRDSDDDVTLLVASLKS